MAVWCSKGSRAKHDRAVNLSCHTEGTTNAPACNFAARDPLITIRHSSHVRHLLAWGEYGVGRAPVEQVYKAAGYVVCNFPAGGLAAVIVHDVEASYAHAFVPFHPLSKALHTTVYVFISVQEPLRAACYWRFCTFTCAA